MKFVWIIKIKIIFFMPKTTRQIIKAPNVRFRKVLFLFPFKCKFCAIRKEKDHVQKNFQN